MNCSTGEIEALTRSGCNGSQLILNGPAVDRAAKRLMCRSRYQPFEQPGARVMFHYIPCLRFQMGARIAFGELFVGMDLHRQIFAHVEEFDQDRELTFGSNQGGMAGQRLSELANCPMQGSTGVGTVGNFAADPAR